MRLTRRMRCHSSSVVSRKGVLPPMPALFESMSIRPNALDDGLSPLLSMDAGSPTSAWTASARPPAASMAAAASFARVLVEIGDRDRRSLAGEDLGRREPDATAASGDESVFSGKAHAPLLSPACRHGRREA